MQVYAEYVVRRMSFWMYLAIKEVPTKVHEKDKVIFVISNRTCSAVHIHAHACLHTYIHTYTHSYIQTYIHTFAHTSYVGKEKFFFMKLAVGCFKRVLRSTTQ